MSGALRRYALIALVVVLATLVYAGSANGYRRAQGAPVNALQICQDGIRFQVAGPLVNGVRLDHVGDRVVVGAQRTAFRSFESNLYLPEEGESIAVPRPLDPDPGTLIQRDAGNPAERFSIIEEGADQRHQRFGATPEDYRTLVISGGAIRPSDPFPEVLTGNFFVQQVATYTLPWLRRLETGDAVNLLLALEGPSGQTRPIGHGPAPLAYEFIGQVANCTLLPGPPPGAHMVGNGILSGKSTHASCQESPPTPDFGVQRTPDHRHSPSTGVGNHPTEVPQGPCPREVSERSLQASYDFDVGCTLPASAQGAPPSVPPPFEVRLDNGQLFKLTDLYGVSCADFSDKGKKDKKKHKKGKKDKEGKKGKNDSNGDKKDGGKTPAAGFDTQTGNGSGTLDGNPLDRAYIEWTVRDGGPGRSRDSVSFTIRRQLCEPTGVHSPPGQADLVTGEPACIDPPGGRLFELNRTVFAGSDSRTGGIAALPPG